MNAGIQREGQDLFGGAEKGKFNRGERRAGRVKGLAESIRIATRCQDREPSRLAAAKTNERAPGMFCCVEEQTRCEPGRLAVRGARGLPVSQRNRGLCRPVVLTGRIFQWLSRGFCAARKELSPRIIRTFIARGTRAPTPESLRC